MLCDDDCSRLRRAARAWPSDAAVKPWLCFAAQVNILIRVYTLSRSHYRIEPISVVHRLILQTQEQLRLDSVRRSRAVVRVLLVG